MIILFYSNNLIFTTKLRKSSFRFSVAYLIYQRVLFSFYHLIIIPQWPPVSFPILDNKSLTCLSHLTKNIKKNLSSTPPSIIRHTNSNFSTNQLLTFKILKILYLADNLISSPCLLIFWNSNLASIHTSSRTLKKSLWIN